MNEKGTSPGSAGACTDYRVFLAVFPCYMKNKAQKRIL